MNFGTMLRDLAAVAGAAAIAYGFWLAYPPAGFVVGGGMALAAAVLSSFAKPKADQ